MTDNYINTISELKRFADEIPNTKFNSIAKINCMVMLNMKYEPISENPNLDEHPFRLAKLLLEESISYLNQMIKISYIEGERTLISSDQGSLENDHHDLFQDLWTNYSKNDYIDRISQYTHRLKVNGLTEGMFKGMRCIDFGCGHGNFLHACLEAGAKELVGIDFGEKSIRYADRVREELGVKEDVMRFNIGSVYDCGERSNSFDFAIQNGVFHHLENEDDAYREVHRVLKPGGWFWIYSDGEGCIKNELWNCAKYILREIPHTFIVKHLEYLNVSVGKRYHLGDGLNAIYRFTSYKELTSRLKEYGFGNFKRLKGGFSYDYDLDEIKNHKYGKEKFGEGNLRILAQKV